MSAVSRGPGRGRRPMKLADDPDRYGQSPEAGVGLDAVQRHQSLGRRGILDQRRPFLDIVQRPAGAGHGYICPDRQCLRSLRSQRQPLLTATEHTASATGASAGAVVLTKFNFAGATPVSAPVFGTTTTATVRSWDATTNATATTPSASVISLSLAVDDTVGTFTDGTWSVANPNTGNVLHRLWPRNRGGDGACLLGSARRLEERGDHVTTPFTASVTANSNPTPRIAISQGGRHGCDARAGDARLRRQRHDPLADL